MDELIAKGAIEPSSDSAGFYSSVFVVPKCTGGLGLILNHKHFNDLVIKTSIHILITICICLVLRCLLSDMSGNLFSLVIMLSPQISGMLIHISLLASVIIFYNLFGIICHMIGKFYLWAGHSL